jgi:protein phosphatase
VVDVDIPDPSLVVLIGAAGSGKSTFAARHFAPDEILSSDAYRALIAGSEGDQGATRAAFGRLHRVLEGRLMARLLTAVDATNVERSARRALLTRASSAGVPAVAIVLDLPTATVLARNASRSRRAGRTVEVTVVRRHLARLRDTLDRPAAPLQTEGFHQIVVLRTAREIDELRIVRQPA